METHCELRCHSPSPHLSVALLWLQIMMPPLPAHTSTSSSTNGAPPKDTLPPSHYASYDLIHCIQDTSNPSPPNSSVVVTATFFTTCIIISLIGGFSLNLALNSKKYREGLKVDVSRQLSYNMPKHMGAGRALAVPEDPVKLATRALGWGTLFSVLGTGGIGLTTVCIWKL